MDLYKEILLKLLENENTKIIIPDLHIDLSEIIEMKCYNTLNKIKEIVQNDSLNDKDCFMKIEMIILQLEELGSDGGFRHDFG